MKMNMCRMVVVMLLSVFCVLFSVVQAADLALPSGDLIAPVIEHTPVEKAMHAGEAIAIKATVTDNVGVKSVILFYRDINAVEFKRVKMNRNLDSFVYTTQLTAIESPGLEYYIQATDLAGNTLLFGYSFSPLTIAVAPIAAGNGSAASASTAMAGSTTKAGTAKAKSGISKWVWIGLGVVVAGAVLSGGGGGGSSEPPAPTGSLTISGLTP